MRSIQKRNRQTALPALAVPDRDGTPVLSFPGEIIENVRYVYTRIGNKEGQLPKSLSIVSALREEGVTTISQAMAATLAYDLRARVCWVDLNWWSPSTSPLIDPDHPGLSDVFAGEAHLADVILRTGWRSLYLLPAGRMPRESRPVVARTPHLKGMLDELSLQFDYMVFDIPAILSTNDSVPLASLGSECCLVIRQGVTTVEDVRLALDEISHLKVAGVILNRVIVETPKLLLRLLPTQ